MLYGKMKKSPTWASIENIDASPAKLMASSASYLFKTYVSHEMLIAHLTVTRPWDFSTEEHDFEFFQIGFRFTSDPC